MNFRNLPADFGALYDGFDQPVTQVDCGRMCAPHNPHGIPFCCDICHAVPVAYEQEWQYLRNITALWHSWDGDECAGEQVEVQELLDQTPPHLRLLACKGPAFCEREMRATSCRQFPFYPYLTSDFRFIGLTYDWEFTSKCWVLSNLHLVTRSYIDEFVNTYDQLFSALLEDLDSYVELSTETREHYAALRKRFPLLHRDGNAYLVSPGSEKLTRINPQKLPAFAPYTKVNQQ